MTDGTENTESKPVEKQVPKFKTLPTIFDLRELIERCFDEARQAGYTTYTPGYAIVPSSIPGNEKLRVVVSESSPLDESTVGRPIALQVVRDERKLAQHIALTIVGELRELEILRKLQPIFRMIPNLVNDFQELEMATNEDFRKRNLRREPEE